MRRAQTLANLALLLPRRPREFRDRVAAYADLGLERLRRGSPVYQTVRWASVIEDIEARLGRVAEILEEPALEETEEDARRLLGDIRSEDPFSPRWAADSRFARLCYLACRLIEPEEVVETGVAYGVSSAYILTALRENERGTLYSVDLPPVRRKSARFWGIAVHDDLEGRWSLHRGTSASILPRLLEGTPTVDLFVHDSLHTHRNMRREFDAVWPHLRGGGLLLADDVERNRAFGELREKDHALWRVIEDRETSPLQGNAAPVVLGVAIK